MQKKKSRSVWIILLVIALLVSTVGGYLALIWQPKATVSDRTTNPTAPSGTPSDPTGTTPSQPDPSQPSQPQGPGSTGTDEIAEDVAVLSQNVAAFTEEGADQINDAILSVEPTLDGVQLRIPAGTAFDSLGIGDIFYLEGSEETPFGCTYIGKVSSVVAEGDVSSYMLETPGIEEVFDQLSFDFQSVLTEENIEKVECIDGIICSFNQPLSSDAHSSTVKPLATLEDELDEPLMFEVQYELDLLEAFGIKPKEPETKNEEVDGAQAYNVKVLRTAKGKRYHTQDCPHMKNNQTKTETTVQAAIAAGLTPCKACNPPVVAGGDDPYSASFTVTGGFGLESLKYGLTCDWDILSGDGLKTFSIYADGTATSSLSVAVDAGLELGPNTTQYMLLDSCIQFEGLKEKMFPLAFVHIAPGTPITLSSGNDSLRALTGTLPVSLVAIVYLDASGNITLGFEAGITHKVNFYYKNLVYSNYEKVDQKETDKTEETTLNLSAEIKGDADGHFGVGLEAYVFNLKIAHLAAMKIGAEAEGMAAIEYERDLKTGEDEFEVEADFYSRLYCKICELELGFKYAADLGPINASGGIDLQFKPVADITFAEWGTKKPTKFYSTSMSYTHITAKDSDALYYIDLDGTLVRSEDGIRSVIYKLPFFCICGIDETYIYLLEDSGLGTGYNIVRVAKDGSTSRKIVDAISNCLAMDGDYFYVLYNFDDSAIYKVDRYDLKDSQFAAFDRPVNYMAKKDNGFYVASGDNDIFSAFFGITCYYYLLDRDGNVIADYGSSPEPAQLDLRKFGTYYAACKMVSTGYLRNTASDVYWLSNDKSSHVLTECKSGWNYFNAGIVTTLSNDGSGKDPYKMVLYSAADGSRRDITTVAHDHAFFTLCQGPQGEWYYFDQTDSQLILYTMSASFTNKTAVKVFDSADMPCNLSDCAVVILDNCIYFYTMPDSTHCSVLYRYDIT